MPQKKSSNNESMKELGSLQKKILFFLSENPNNNTQAIQRGIEYPDAQYPNILKDVKTLKKSKLVKSRKGKSMKNVSIDIYSCTEEGAFYALARNPNVNVLDVLDAYKDQYNLYKSFRALYDVFGRGRFVRFIRIVNEFLPMVQKDGLQKALPFLFMKFTTEAKDEDPIERKRFAREMMKLFPQTKQTMKEWAKSMNEVVGE